MFGKFGIWELIIILVIILLLFGTKKLRNAGGDIGSAFKNFKKAFKDEDDKTPDSASDKENGHLNDESGQKSQDAQFSESKDTEENKKS